MLRFSSKTSVHLNSVDYFPHNLIYSVHKLRAFPPLQGKKESDNKSQSTKFNKIRYSCFKKQGEEESCFFIVYTGIAKEKETKMDSYQSNYLSVLQIPLKTTILLIWCQMPLKCSYPRKVCFWKNKESNTFKGWRKFSSIYLGQWNIHHTETQTPYRIKDQRCYTSRSKSQCLWGNQQVTVWTDPPVISLLSLAYVIGGVKPQSRTC